MGDRSIEERIRYRRENAVEPEAFLREEGVIRPVDGGEQLRLTAEFESRLARHLETVRREGVTTADVAGIFGVDEANVAVENRPYVAYKIEFTVRSWPSEGALVLDAATDAALSEASDRWEVVPPRQRYRILQSMRSFQDACVFCGGAITLDEESVESCCSERQVIRLYCADCDRRFLEFAAEHSPDPLGDVSGAR